MNAASTSHAPEGQPADTGRRLRVAIVQPSLARYRVPVYRRLAEEPDLDIRVVYGQDEGIPNELPDGFRAEMRPHRLLGIGGRRPFIWQPAQIELAHIAKADVLVTVWNTRWLSLFRMIQIARREGVRVVLWGHGYSKNEAAWRRWARERLGRMADAVLFYSRSVADTYEAAGFPPDRIFVAPNSLDQEEIQGARDRWVREEGKLEAFRAENEIREGPVVLHVSRMDPANRLDLLLEAIERLRTEFPDVRLHVVGKGEPTLTDLNRQAALLGIEDRVHFLGAVYGEESLSPWFLTADVFCYPQNIGLSLHHAMGYGLPVVTGDDPAVQNPEVEAVRDGENGCLFRSGDAASLAETLAKLFRDATLRGRLGREAHRTATVTYGLEAMVGGMAAAIRGERGPSSLD